MFATRLATAVALLVFSTAALLFLPNRWWAALLLAALALAGREWAALAGMARPARWAFSAVVLASAVLLWIAPPGIPGSRRFAPDVVVYGVSGAFWLLLVPAWITGRWRARTQLARGVVGWIVLVPAWLALTRLQSDPERLLALLGVVWLADTTAYLAGSAWGKRKLAPLISPGKTWEGLAGAAAAVAVYYGVMAGVAPGWAWWRGVGGAALVAGIVLMSIAGDLFESLIKRQAGVKDSGTLLPGHGGILDRIDSLTSSMPFAALVLLYIG